MSRDTHLTRRAFVSLAALAAGGIAATGLAACAGGAMPQGEVDDAAHEGRVAEPGGTEPAVYLIHDVSPEAMRAVYDALGTSLSGTHTGVKLSTGEPGSNPLDPGLIEGLVRAVDGTIVECNTAYGGERGETRRHYEVAAEHGYTGIADVQIMDEDGSVSIPVTGGEHVLEHAEKIGLGSRAYQLVEVEA